MNILLIGLNHKTAPVALREKLALDSCAPLEAYNDLVKYPSLKEALYLSTCNRVEIVVITDDKDSAAMDIKHFLGAANKVPSSEFENHLYIFQDASAVTHLFQVASSLDSMVVGEPQILGQLKEAYREAAKNKATGAILNKLMHKSFSVAKRVRTETGIASHAVSIGFAAVELARKIFGQLGGRKVMLLGAGEMAELTAEHLLTHGASDIVVANRTLKRAVELAQRWKGRAAALEEVPTFLAEVDIVISSTGASRTVVSYEMVKSVLKARKHRPLFFVDIAVPRDVDPAINRLDNIYLYDIDDLSSVVEENRAARSEEAARAVRIVQEETISYLDWLSKLDTFPTIVALKEKAECVRQAELKRTLARIGPLTREQMAALDIMTRSMTHKLLHHPILFIKNAGRHGRKDMNLDLARRVFGLDSSEDDEGLVQEELEEKEENTSVL